MLARVERDVEVGGRTDLGETPKIKEIPRPVAVVWALRGSEEDHAHALLYAKREGYEVFCYPEGESDPLGRAKEEVLVRVAIHRRSEGPPSNRIAQGDLCHQCGTLLANCFGSGPQRCSECEARSVSGLPPVRFAARCPCGQVTVLERRELRRGPNEVRCHYCGVMFEFTPLL